MEPSSSVLGSVALLDPLKARALSCFSLDRMKSLEQDALKAQMVIAKSKEGKKRSTLEQLAESPSPAPTPSPTPPDGMYLVASLSKVGAAGDSQGVLVGRDLGRGQDDAKRGCPLCPAG